MAKPACGEPFDTGARGADHDAVTAWAYILRCADGSYYVGSTRDLATRLWEHGEGSGAEYTRRRLPVELVWSGEYPNVGEAFAWEKRIQGWSRAKREALINEDFDSLPALAKKTFPRLKAVTMPQEVIAVTDAFLTHIDASRPLLLHALFLHGSLCWGEFFADSDIDFVAVLTVRPSARDLAALEEAHAAVREMAPNRRYEGFYCLPGDLGRPPSSLGSVPVHFEGRFDVAGRTGVNPVTWHELAERGLCIRGRKPKVRADVPELLDYTRENLSSYWAALLARIEDGGDRAIGENDRGVAWATLGIARLHHLLARRELTSKSGAGRYVLEALDQRWHRIAAEALAIREQPGARSAYDDPAERGRDVREFLAWAIDDARGLH